MRITATLTGMPIFPETRNVSRAKKSRKATANHPISLVSVTWGRGHSHSQPNSAAKNRAPSRFSQFHSSCGGDAIENPSPKSFVEVVVDDPRGLDAEGRQGLQPPVVGFGTVFRARNPKQFHLHLPVG